MSNQRSTEVLERVDRETQSSADAIYEAALTSSVLAGVGRYLRTVVASSSGTAADIAPAMLADFPVLADTKPSYAARNVLIQAARQNFLQRATASPQATPLNLTLHRVSIKETTAELLRERVTAVSTFGGCVLLEHARYDDDGNETGHTYWVHPTRFLADQWVEGALAQMPPEVQAEA